MNLSRGIQAIVGIGVVTYARRAVEHAGDERNIRALARHLGCSPEDARRLYVQSREVGYGAAYRDVFPTGGPPGSAASTPRGPMQDESTEVRPGNPRSGRRLHH